MFNRSYFHSSQYLYNMLGSAHISKHHFVLENLLIQNFLPFLYILFSCIKTVYLTFLMVALFHEWSLSTTIIPVLCIECSWRWYILEYSPLSLQTSMAERFYNVVTTTTSFVDNYKETPATALFCFKQQFVSTLGSCAILCTKEKDHPCEGFTLTIENETGTIVWAAFTIHSTHMGDWPYFSSMRWKRLHT